MPLARVQCVVSGRNEPNSQFWPGVDVRPFVSDACGSKGFSTSTVTFPAGGETPYHRHRFSEALTVISGCAAVAVEGRTYVLSGFDCVHIPAGVPHRVGNGEGSETVVHRAYASAVMSREIVRDGYPVDHRRSGNARTGEPEFIVRFADAEAYELSEGAFFRDLFASRFGSVGICGGYGRFQPGSSLPCHVHKFDESITIVEGEAVCLVQGQRYTLSGCDTAFVPEGRPHRFLNYTGQPMAMIWVYAGSEPERTLVEAGYCSGELVWPGRRSKLGDAT